RVDRLKLKECVVLPRRAVVVGAETLGMRSRLTDTKRYWTPQSTEDYLVTIGLVGCGQSEQLQIEAISKEQRIELVEPHCRWTKERILEKHVVRKLSLQW